MTKMETGVKQRLIEFIKSKKLSQARFEKAVGVSNGFVNNISKGIGADKLQRIIGVYPDLNADWLMTGLGQMLKPAKNPFSQMTESEIEDISSEVFAEKLMQLYKKGEIYPASIHDKIIAEKNNEIAKRDELIAKLQREVWELQQKIIE